MLKNWPSHASAEDATMDAPKVEDADVQRQMHPRSVQSATRARPIQKMTVNVLSNG